MSEPRDTKGLGSCGTAGTATTRNLEWCRRHTPPRAPAGGCRVAQTGLPHHGGTPLQAAVSDATQNTRSRACFSSAEMPQLGVMSPTMLSARSCTSAISTHRDRFTPSAGKHMASSAARWLWSATLSAAGTPLLIHPVRFWRYVVSSCKSSTLRRLRHLEKTHNKGEVQCTGNRLGSCRCCWWEGERHRTKECKRSLFISHYDFKNSVINSHIFLFKWRNGQL
jgi:hypothetical protein